MWQKLSLSCTFAPGIGTLAPAKVTYTEFLAPDNFHSLKTTVQELSTLGRMYYRISVSVIIKILSEITAIN